MGEKEIDYHLSAEITEIVNIVFFKHIHDEIQLQQKRNCFKGRKF